MSEPFLGEIRLMPYGFVPKGWAMCNGASLNVQDYPSLYAVLGTNYGGDGKNWFKLPDLQGRVATHQGQGFFVGEQGGLEYVTLNIATLPQHGHLLMSSTEAGSNFPSDTAVLTESGQPAYTWADKMVALAPDTCSLEGGNLPHNNIQPSLVMNYCIAMTGLFPSRN